MSEAIPIKSVVIQCTLGGFIVMLLGALFGSFGPGIQELAFSYGITLCIGLITFCLGLVLMADWSRARPRISRGKALSGCGEDQRSVDRVDSDAARLRSNLELMRRDEDDCEERYSQRLCSFDDVVRARAQRVQAEIELIRYEKRPKSWAEACAEHHGCRQ